MTDLEEREVELFYASLERDLTPEESEELNRIHQQQVYEEFEDEEYLQALVEAGDEEAEVYEDEDDEVEETSPVFGVDFGDGLEEDQFVDEFGDSFAEWLKEAY